MLMYKNYLFDLDGTLLPMDMEKFVKLYFSSLCKRCTPVIKIEPDALIKAMWAGTDAMTKNDNSRTNREVFWETAGKVSGADLEKFDEYRMNQNIVGYVFDAHEPGSGKTFDWTMLENLPRDDKLFILAGGLNSETVAKAVKAVKPDGVDVSSGVENSNGNGKDFEKVKKFIISARSEN